MTTSPEAPRVGWAWRLSRRGHIHWSWLVVPVWMIGLGYALLLYLPEFSCGQSTVCRDESSPSLLSTYLVLAVPSILLLFVSTARLLAGLGTPKKRRLIRADLESRLVRAKDWLARGDLNPAEYDGLRQTYSQLADEANDDVEFSLQQAFWKNLSVLALLFFLWPLVTAVWMYDLSIQEPQGAGFTTPIGHAGAVAGIALIALAIAAAIKFQRHRASSGGDDWRRKANRMEEETLKAASQRKMRGPPASSPVPFSFTPFRGLGR